MDQILKNIIQSLKNTSAQAFFNQIVLNFASAIDVEYVFIAKIDKEANTSSTIALSAQGKIADNFVYNLKDTPCADVSNNQVCTYAENITQLFPDDKLLSDMGIESYVGSPLYDSKGKILGITVALCEKRIEDPEKVTTLFEIFSGRIAVEMERTTQENELKKANQDLKKQLELIEAKDKKIKLYYEAMQNSADAMLITDNNNKIIHINKAFEDIYGLHPSDTLGKNPNILSNKNKEKSFYKNMWDELQSKGLWKGEISNKNAQGKEVPFLVSITALYNENNEIENYLAMYTDLSQRKESEAILRQQTKMASMGEMLSSITHQWKQPISVMQAIFSNIEVQKELEGINLDNYDEHINTIKTQVNHMIVTMNDFKNFLSPDKKAKDFLLEEGLNDICKLFDKQYKVSNLSIQTTIHQSAYVSGFYNEYKQVLVNIINNALDAYTEKKIIKKDLMIEISHNDEFGLICIKDLAGGIKDSMLDKVFHPYVTTKSTDKGTGIGLYMAKNIIENMKGNIQVYNEAQGAVFEIRLPLSKH